MDKLRLYIWVALAGVLYYLYILWQQDYPPPAAVTPSIAQPARPSDTLPPLPNEKPLSNSSASASPSMSSVAPAVEVATAPAEQIHVRTDVFDLNISTRGGELDRADLLKYPVEKDKPNEPVQLFNETPATYFVARSGLRATQEADAPTSQSLYTSNAKDYAMHSDQDTLKVQLDWNHDGIAVTKTYTFHRGSYAIGIDYQVHNQSTSEWRGASYVQLFRRHPTVKTSIFSGTTYAHTGPATYDSKSYHKLKLTSSDDRDYKNSNADGWMAAMQHQFVAAAVPDPKQTYDYQLSVADPQTFTFSYRGPVESIAPSASGAFHETIYVGPTLQAQLKAVGSKLELTTDYGIFTIISQPLFLVLSFIHSLLGNWGWSIIVVTLLIKLVFYKLTEASGRSMAKMRAMAPRLKALQERYKDDREQLGRATMEFYKREKINPVAGCLPMLIQMPFWMAFYWVLANSVEMRQAPFMGWITDLTSRDPYFVLPIILGIVNFVQFKLNPAPADPTQAKVMSVMPIAMAVMMAWFPAGLALYWVTNTLLSILQQWHINRVVSDASKKA